MFYSTYNIVLFIIGIISSLITIIGWFPQAIKTFKTHDTTGISLVFYSLIYISSIFWIIYALLTLFNPDTHWSVRLASSLPVLITNIVALLLNTIIVLIKFKNIARSKKLNITEREYIDMKMKQKSTEQ